MVDYTYTLYFSGGKRPLASGMDIDTACVLLKAMAEEYSADPSIGFVLVRKGDEEQP